MAWIRKARFLFCGFTLWFCGCSSQYHPGDYHHNICHIVNDHWGWKSSLNLAKRHWGISPGLVLSVIYHESAFESHARPPRTKLWGIFPWRVSSAFGYGQIKDETWAWYREKQPAIFLSRTSFHDTTQFIGWYYTQFLDKARDKKQVYYDFYIAYHEGIGGYSRFSDQGNTWLQKKARSVSDLAISYDQQLQVCL